MIISIILHDIHVKVIDLQLLASEVKPFLKIGITIPDFQVLGTHEHVINKLKIHDNEKAISGATFKKNILGNLSSPPLSLVLNVFYGFSNFFRREMDNIYLIRGIIVQRFKFGHQIIILYENTSKVVIK